MKKLAAVLAASLCLLLCACGQPADANTPAPEGTVPVSAAPESASPEEPAQVETAPALESAAPADEPQTSAPEASAANAGAPFTQGDLALDINGTVYRVLDDSTAILAALGDGYEYSESVSCVFDGDDKVFAYPSLEVDTYPDGEKDIIDQFVLLDDTYQTVRGIAVGATKDEVIAQYGDQFFMDGEYMTYNVANSQDDYTSPRCYFQLDENDTVLTIGLHVPTLEE